MNFLSLVANTVSKSSEYQLRQAAIRTHPFEINGKMFFTKQSCQSNRLLNGIKLEFEEARGISQNIEQIAYLYLSQEVAFCSGSNIISYSPQRKQFNNIVQASNVQMIRSFYEKNCNRQYLLWLQRDKNSRILYLFDCQEKIKIFQENIPNNLQVCQLIMMEEPLAKVIGFTVATQDFNTEIHYKVIYQQEQKKGKTKLGFEIYFLSQEVFNIKYSPQIHGFIYSENEVLLSLTFKVDSILRQVSIENQKLLQSKSGQIVDFQTNESHLILVTKQRIDFYTMKPFNFSHDYQINNIFQNKPKCEHINVKYIRANQSSLILIHDDDSMVSAFTISGNTIQLVSTNALKLESMTQVIKIYLNPFNSQVTTLTRHFESQPEKASTINPYHSKLRRQNSSLRDTQKKYHYEITTSYMALNSLKAGSNKLSLKPQKYLNILTASWTPTFFVQTDHEIISEKWSDIFQNVKCAAIHPYGLYMLVGFKDCFKIYSVTNEGIINTYRGDSIKDCHALAYSVYGNHFAVGTSISIIVYASYDCKKLKTIPIAIGLAIEDLRYSHGQLLCTMKSKRKFIYCAQNNYKESFSFNPKSHSNEVKNQSQVNSIFYDSNLKVVIFSALNKLYFINIEDYSTLDVFQFQNVTCLEYCELLETLFLGTQTGSIYIFNWPNKPANITQQMPVYKFHEGRVLKIKVSSDLREFMSIDSDGSLYRCSINIIHQMKRINLKQWLDLKKVNEQKLACHILSDMKLCQYTYTQMNKKSQDLKYLEDQTTGCNFIYPEERQKQKSTIVKQIRNKKQQMKKWNDEAYGALNKNDLQIKAMSSKIQHQFCMLEPMHRRNVDDEKRKFQQKLSNILKQREALRSLYDQKFKQYQLETNKTKKEYTQQIKKFENDQLEFLRKKQSMLARVSQRKQQTSFDQYHLKQIEQQSEIIKNNELIGLQTTKQQLSCRNGFLNCKINETKKNIINTKRKIEEMQYLIHNTKLTNQKLAQCKPKQLNDDSARILQAQKSSMQAMKDLIEKGKQIDVSIKVFQRQQKIVIVLEKALEKTQQQIQKIVQDVENEKKQRKFRQQRHTKVIKKVQALLCENNKIQKRKIVARNILKAFITTIYLYLDKSIKYSEMVEKLALEKVEEPITYKSFDLKRSEQIVLKKIKQEERVSNYILNQKKYFASTFRKMNIQNQDLVKSLNQLRCQNKSIINSIRNQENRMSDIRKSSLRPIHKISPKEKVNSFPKLYQNEGQNANRKKNPHFTSRSVILNIR